MRIQPTDRTGVDARAVPHDGDAGCVFEHFLEAVSDVDDPDAPCAKIANDREQSVGFVLREGRGRLVHEDDPGIADQGARDLDHLGAGGRQGPHRRSNVDVEAKLGEDGARLFAHGGPVEGAEPRAGSRASHEEVLADREVRKQVQLLRDHGDARDLRITRGGEAQGLAGYLDRAFVDRVDAVQQLHERGLASAVLAQNRVDLTGHHGQIDAAAGPDATELLADPPHPAQLGGGGDRRGGEARGLRTGRDHDRFAR